MSAVPACEVKIGDLVEVQFKVEDDLFTIKGLVHLDTQDGDLIIAGWTIADANGNPGPYCFCVTKRTPAQPPVGTMVIDRDGDYWAHVPEGWVFLNLDRRGGAKAWERLVEDYSMPEIVTGA